MGKKLAPLRKIFAGSKSGQNEESSLGKRAAGATNSRAHADSKREKKSKKKDEDEDDVDWEKVEAEQQNGDDSSGGSDEEDDEEGGSEDGDGINLDGNLEHVVEDFTFEFNDMRDDFSEGICTMLRKLISNPTDAYALATVVTSQTIVGTVVNSEGATDSFAFATILPFRKLEKVAALSNILDGLVTGLDKYLTSAPNEELQLLRDCTAWASTTKGDKSASGSKSPKPSFIHAARTGLLLHKRFTNLPIQLVGALHRNLEEDVSWAQQQATDDDELVQESSSSSSSNSAQKVNKPNSSGNFFADARNVVLLCECSVTKSGKSTYSLSESGPCYNVLGSCSDIIFSCFEDEVYLQHATAAVLFRPPQKVCSTDLVALLVPISKLQKCANGICGLIPE